VDAHSPLTTHHSTTHLGGWAGTRLTLNTHWAACNGRQQRLPLLRRELPELRQVARGIAQQHGGAGGSARTQQALEAQTQPAQAGGGALGLRGACRRIRLQQHAYLLPGYGRLLLRREHRPLGQPPARGFRLGVVPPPCPQSWGERNRPTPQSWGEPEAPGAAGR